MEVAETQLRELLAKNGVLIRSSGHEIYLLVNGHSVSIRRPNKKGNNDHWKSALSYVKRTLRLPPVAKPEKATG